MSRRFLRACCHRPNQVYLSDELLILRDGGGLRGHRRLLIAPWLEHEVIEALLASDLDCMPAVHLVEAAPNEIAFAMPGLVVLGQRDIEALAQRVWAENARPVDQGRPARGQHLATFDQVRLATWRFVIAHELGHVRQFSEDDLGPRLEMEVEADVHAGQVAEVLEWDEVLGGAVARTIGCRDHSCRREYPTGRGRERAYDVGRELQEWLSRDHPSYW